MLSQRMFPARVWIRNACWPIANDGSVRIAWSQGATCATTVRRTVESSITVVHL